MYNIDELTLITGVDISVPEIGENIHQPLVRDIAIIGEKKFYKYLSYFSISRQAMETEYKKKLEKELEATNATEEQINDLVKSILGESNDFDILMQFINPIDKKKLSEVEKQACEDIKQGIEVVLMLTLPDYTFQFEERFILCSNTKKKKTLIIDDKKLKILKEIFDIIFCLNSKEEQEFNPLNDKAKSIADKLKKSRERVRNLKGDKLSEAYILANYISSIGIGTNALNIFDAVNLTVYELFNQMKRFGLKTQHDYSVQSVMAGAKDVEIVDWLESQR